MRIREGPHKARFLRAIGTLGLSLLALVSGRVLPLNAATNASVGIRLHIKNPPNAITDLQAAPVGSQTGDIQLNWTAPANANQIPIDHYLIRFATYAAANQAQAEAWWSALSSSEQQAGPAFAPGTPEFKTLLGFTPGVTYYFGIKSVDDDGMVSPIDDDVGTANQASSVPLNIDPPSTPTNFAGVALSSTTIRWTWDLTPTATSYLLYTSPASALIGQTSNLSLDEAGFTPNVSLSRFLRAANANGLSAPTATQTRFTLAVTPINVVITTVSATTITLTWSANGNAAGTQYRVERSLNDIAFVNAGVTTNSTLQNSGLTASTTYYYRVRALNGDGIATAPTLSISTVTKQSGDIVAPDSPLGLRGSLDPTNTAFTLIWESPLKNADGSALTDLAGYRVYRRTTMNGTPSLITPVPLTITAFADVVNGQTFYYTVHALDTNGNESVPSLIADSSGLTNIIYLASDGVSLISMPSSVNDLLTSANNKYGVPLTVAMTEQPIPSQTELVRHVRFFLVRGDNNQPINDLAFAKPHALVGVAYTTVAGQVVTGAPNALAAQKYFTSATPNDLSLYWFNGVTWVKIGGTLDTVVQAIKTKSSFLGDYQLRVGARATSLNLEQTNVYPRVFTPNSDGFNDLAYFVLENPNNVSVQGEILDLNGRSVKTLSTLANSGIGTTLTWDGTDNAGSVVPAGAYLYRIQGEGKTFTGTVAVAR